MRSTRYQPYTGARAFRNVDHLQFGIYRLFAGPMDAAGHEPVSGLSRPVIRHGRRRTEAGRGRGGSDGRGAVTGQGEVVSWVNVTLILSYCMTLQLLLLLLLVCSPRTNAAAVSVTVA